MQTSINKRKKVLKQTFHVNDSMTVVTVTADFICTFRKWMPALHHPFLQKKMRIFGSQKMKIFYFHRWFVLVVEILKYGLKYKSII
jgi:hypothetical protein